MSFEKTVHTMNHSDFKVGETFEASVDSFSNGLDYTFSPGILETELSSNRSSILSANDDSISFCSSRNFLMKKLEEDSDLNKTRTNEDNSSDSKSELNNAKQYVDERELIDIDKLSLNDESNWLIFNKPSHALSNNALNILNDDSLKKKNNSIINQSPLKRYSSGKIEKFGDFGQVTQIIGVPPLSASNKDLSTAGKELSLGKQQQIDNMDSNKNQQPLSVSNSKLNFGSGYVLADFGDVQNAAKLQEQSLRMSFSTPMVSKGLSLKSSNKKINEAGVASKSKTQVTKGTGRSPARNAAPLSQFNSNSIKKHSGESFQKSLPNLTRKLQTAKGPTGGRSLPQSGPPVRTASQPAGVAQLKPLQRKPPQRTASTQLKPQNMTLNQKNLNTVKKSSLRAPPVSLNTTSRQPLPSRQPASRQSITSNRQTTLSSRQPSSTTRQQLPSAQRQLPPTNRGLPSSSKLPSNNTSRIVSNTIKMPSTTRTPLNNPPMRNITQLKSRTATVPASNRVANTSMLAKSNLMGTGTKTTQLQRSTRANLTTVHNNDSRGNASMIRTAPKSARSQVSSVQSKTSTTNKLNSTTSFAGRANLSSRTNAPTSTVLKSTSRKTPNTTTKTPTNRSLPTRGTTSSSLTKNYFNKPIPNKVVESSMEGNGDNDNWKDDCF